MIVALGTVCDQKSFFDTYQRGILLAGYQLQIDNGMIPRNREVACQVLPDNRDPEQEQHPLINDRHIFMTYSLGDDGHVTTSHFPCPGKTKSDAHEVTNDGDVFSLEIKSLCES